MQEKSAAREHFEKTAVIKSKEVYRGKTIAIRNDLLKTKEGLLTNWDVVIHPGSVVLAPVTKNQEIILIKQWRRVVEKRIFELPAGTLEKDEKPIVCAQRELQEETGFRSNKLIGLGGFYSTPGLCTEYLHLFLALDLEPAPLPQDEDEGIDLFCVSLQKAENMIETGEICDAKTIAGVYRYAQWFVKS